MKEIQLTSMSIRHFKGIESLDINFSESMAIYGRNGLGKSSILDAFLWCLFGKDSSGASSFSVKPVDSSGNIIEFTDVEVCCNLEINWEPISLKRKWIEKRSKTDNSYKGNEGVYFINDAPVKESIYKSKISEICSEELFMLITSTGAFNRMKDAEKRQILAGMSSIIPDIEIAEDFPFVKEALLNGVDVDTFKNDIKNKRSKAEVEKAQYPTRLKENTDSRPILPADIDAYPQKLKEIEENIAACDKVINDNADCDTTALREKKINDIQNDMREIERSINSQYQKLDDEYRSKKLAKLNERNSLIKVWSTMKDSLTKLDRDIDSHNERLQQVRNEWTEANESEAIVEVNQVCPTCNRPYDEYDISVMRDNIIKSFNEDKLKRLSDIDARGKSIVSFIKDSELRKEEMSKDIADIAAKIESIESEIREIEHKLDELPNIKSAAKDASKEYNALQMELARLKTESNVSQPTTIDVTREGRNNLVAERNRILSELSKLDEIKRLDDRKLELESKYAEIGQIVANYNKIEAEILAFSLKKNALIEESVSSKFRLVKFKMFEHNLTNDNIREVCVCTVNGVPYASLNTAMKYNADIDIINALSAHYEISAPVFIDRAESINDIERTNGQRIDLYATIDDKVLRFEHLNK